jgi:hypothetical protein
MRRWFVPVIVLAMTLAASGASGGLYSLSYDRPSDLAQLETRGVAVRLIGNGSALVEGDVGRADALALGWQPVAGPGEGERLYLCYPAVSFAPLERFGRIVWTDGGGGFVVVARPEAVDSLRSLCFMVLALPASIDVGAWFDSTLPPLVSERAPERELAVRGLVEDVLSEVSSDSLMGCIRRLSEYSDGSLRTRFVLRDECLTEAKPYIMGKLSSYLPEGSVVDTQRFFINAVSCDGGGARPTQDYPAENIIGTLPGTGRLKGCYIVCAHYDAIASHSFPGDALWFCDNPAPGADDNGTGVATVLEAARVLSGVSFPFDVRFILFTGEELGLLGSTAYADSVAAQGDTIYGVLNTDMVGYKRTPEAPDTCDIVTNPASRWLGDWVVETADEYSACLPTLNVRRIDSDAVAMSLLYSDHAPFWLAGYDGVAAVEHWNPRDRNPYYHTLGDTIGNVSSSQLANVGRLVAGSMARLADASAEFNLAVFPTDVSVSPTSPQIDDIARVTLKIHAYGPDTEAAVTVTVRLNDPDDGEVLDTFSVDRTMGGGEVIHHQFWWEVTDDDLGEDTFYVSVSTDGVEELTLSDNDAAATVVVTDPNRLFVLGHYAYPNPVRPGETPHIRYELSRAPAAVSVDVFDLTGQVLGQYMLGIGEPDYGAEGTGTRAGWNTIDWEHLRDGGAARLASGVYIYRLRVYREGDADPADQITGKFAVVR